MKNSSNEIRMRFTGSMGFQSEFSLTVLQGGDSMLEQGTCRLLYKRTVEIPAVLSCCSESVGDCPELDIAMLRLCQAARRRLERRGSNASQASQSPRSTSKVVSTSPTIERRAEPTGSQPSGTASTGGMSWGQSPPIASRQSAGGIQQSHLPRAGAASSMPALAGAGAKDAGQMKWMGS